MTGGQPSATSPVNLAGQPGRINMVKALEGQGAKVKAVSGYDRKAIKTALKETLAEAEKGEFTCLVVQGTCIRKVPKEKYGQRLVVDKGKMQALRPLQYLPWGGDGRRRLPRVQQPLHRLRFQHSGLFADVPHRRAEGGRGAARKPRPPQRLSLRPRPKA